MKNCWDCNKVDGNFAPCYCHECEGCFCLKHVTEIVIDEECDIREGNECNTCRGRVFSSIFKQYEDLRVAIRCVESLVLVDKGDRSSRNNASGLGTAASNGSPVMIDDESKESNTCIQKSKDGVRGTALVSGPESCSVASSVGGCYGLLQR